MQKNSRGPAVSIILPFDIRASIRKEVRHRLKVIAQKIVRELEGKYQTDEVRELTNKLDNISRNFQFDKRRKGAILYLSPSEERIIQVDEILQEKIIIGGKFDLLTVCRVMENEMIYLVILIKAKRVYGFIGHDRQLDRIRIARTDHIAAFVNDMPERVGNFSDPEERRENNLKKFLRHIDVALSNLVKIYPVPVFILGISKTNGIFHRITGNDKHIAAYITYDCKNPDRKEILGVLAPQFEKWTKIREKWIFHQLEEAADKRLLIMGVREVEKAVQEGGRTLVIEDNYDFGVNGQNDIPENRDQNSISFQRRSRVNDWIEWVFEKGGRVEIVEKGSMDHYQHIALVKFY